MRVWINIHTANLAEKLPCVRLHYEDGTEEIVSQAVITGPAWFDFNVPGDTRAWIATDSVVHTDGNAVHGLGGEGQLQAKRAPVG